MTLETAKEQRITRASYRKTREEPKPGHSFSIQPGTMYPEANPKPGQNLLSTYMGHLEWML